MSSLVVRGLTHRQPRHGLVPVDRGQDEGEAALRRGAGRPAPQRQALRLYVTFRLVFIVLACGSQTILYVPSAV